MRRRVSNGISGIDRCHQSPSQTEQHHPVPLLVHLGLLLICRDLLQVREFLEPCQTPVDVSVLIHLDALLRADRHPNWLKRWKAHALWTPHHLQNGVEAVHTTVRVKVGNGPERSRRIPRGIRSERSRPVRSALVHGLGDELGVGIVKARLGGMVVDISILRDPTLAFGFLFPDAVHAGAGIHVVVHGPVRALSAVRERTRDFLETRVERKIMSN